MIAGWKACVRACFRGTAVVAMWAMALIAASLSAQVGAREPRIMGIAHVAVYQSDLNSARSFYKDLLGFEEPFSLKRPDGADWMAVIKINDRQYVELFAGTPENGGHISHFALYTDDAARMRAYLAARGVTMVDQLHTGQTGDLFFTIKDPDGHFIEIVEYQRDSQSGKALGKFMPAQRISTRLTHVGVLVGALEPSLNFYRDILGFKEIGRGSGNQATLIDMAVPDGSDYVELILDPGPPSPTQHKIQNHISLLSADIQKTALDLQSRAGGVSYARKIDVRAGVGQARQVDLFGPDGTRVEIMEPAAPGARPAAPQRP